MKMAQTDNFHPFSDTRMSAFYCLASSIYRILHGYTMLYSYTWLALSTMDNMGSH